MADLQKKLGGSNTYKVAPKRSNIMEDAD